jgi:hypothetical protein
MRRDLVVLAVAMAVGGLVLAWRVSAVGVERTFAVIQPPSVPFAPPPSVVVQECGSLVQPFEDPRPPCRSSLDGQMANGAELFYLAEFLLLAAAWLAVAFRKPGRSRRRSDFVVGGVALLVSPLFLMPGQAVGFGGSWGKPMTTTQILLFLGALPVPVAMWAFWSRRSSRKTDSGVACETPVDGSLAEATTGGQ